ncbi:MAG TPA: cupin domain-containing protein [Pyrinomonadaceae bacterium]|nr:cupin domain-containing protein [Pyrinomonadaceae bacterium]
MNGSINSLEKLLEPCLAEEFLQTTWGKTYRHIVGWRGKFTPLLPWNRLNEILAEHRLDFPRLRLARSGKSLPASTYLRYARSPRAKSSIPKLLSTELVKQLREGATLVLDAVDELHAPLRELAEGLEFYFREHIQINAYAGWQIEKGFDLHFDDHDVFILQVAGRKRWKIYGMTHAFPLASDRGIIEKPESDSIWEGMLLDGDVLYIPRGWWHVAEPQAEPTLHLTVGVHNQTGVDLLRWLSEKMKASAAFRKDLPRFSSDEESQAHIEQLKEALLSEWDESLLKRYLDDTDALALPRPHTNLPLSVTNESLSSSTLIRLAAPRPINFAVKEGVLEFNCNKKRWRFAAETLPIFRRLENRNICSVSELCEAAEGSIDEERVRALLNELLFHGLLSIVDAHF